LSLRNAQKSEVACTIVANNYVAAARCFTNSFLEHHPNGVVHVLLVDRVGAYEPEKERFITVSVEELEIPKILDMVLRYDVLELCTAVKPYFLDYLFKKYNYENVCYFDPDIYFYEYLDDIWAVLKNYHIVLIPHLLGPVDDTNAPNERHILGSGTYNLGFIGLANHPDVFSLLEWWKKKLIRYCSRSEENLFVDQKWIDLVPGYYDGVYIMRNPAYNVAYWDLTNRRVTKNDGKYLVNGKKLRFFHFSGFSPDNPTTISKYQNRHTFGEQKDLIPLFESYSQCLEEMGLKETKNIPNQFAGTLGRTSRIEKFREIWTMYEFDHPFKWNADPIENEKIINKLLIWLNTVDAEQERTTCLTRVAIAVYNNDPYLKHLFPEAYGNDEISYALWFIRRAKQRRKIPRMFIVGMQKSLFRRFLNNPVFVLRGIVRYVWLGLQSNRITQ